MITKNGIDYYETPEVCDMLKNKKYSNPAYNRRFQKYVNNDTTWMKSQTARGSAHFYTKKQVDMILKLEAEREENEKVKPPPRKKKPSDQDKVSGKGDYALSENIKKGYYTRITGYWHI